VNREFKRRMKREQQQQERSMMRGGQRPPVPVQQRQRRQRLKIRQYLGEIRAELRRVIWPTRQEVFTYSVVVIFVVTVLTGIVFALDLGFAQAIVELFRPATR
jgi:preprotein translocase subunit SecE